MRKKNVFFYIFPHDNYIIESLVLFGTETPFLVQIKSIFLIASS